MLFHFHHGGSIWLMFATTCIFVSLIQWCQANPAWLTQKVLCETLDVQHGILTPEDMLSSESVQIRLENNGEESSCYKPGIYYNVTIKSINSMPIYGLLFLQPKDKKFGTFPYVETDRTDGDRRRILKDGLTDRFCDNAVSHRCIYSDKKDHRKRCNLGATLELPFLAPEDRTNVVHFKYSIVFEMKKFLENQEVMFPACPCEGECTKVPHSHRVCDASEFRETTIKAPTCKKRRHISSVVRYAFKNGVNYTCTATVRMNNCSTGCEKGGKTVCCRVEKNNRTRKFKCTHSDSSAKMEMKFLVEEGRKCECFFCKDVCPVVPSVENSAEVEHNTEMGGNDVVDVSSSSTTSPTTNTQVQSSEVQRSMSSESLTDLTTNSNTEMQSSEEEVQSSTTSSKTILDSV